MIGIVKEVHNAIFYPPGAMWFISASMIAAIIIALLFNHEKFLVIVAILGYSFALITNTYYYLIENTPVQDFVDAYLDLFVSGRNGFFVGIIQFGAGVFLFRYKEKFEKLSTCKVVFLTILCYGVLFVETLFSYGKQTRDDSSLFLIMPLLSIFLFELAKRIKLPYSGEVSLKYRTFSKQLFFLHPFFNVYIGYVLFYLTKNGVIQFLYVFACCLAVMLWRKRTNKRWIKMILPD